MCEMEKKIDKKVKSVSIWSFGVLQCSIQHSQYALSLPLHSSLPFRTCCCHHLVVSIKWFFFFRFFSFLGQFPNITSSVRSVIFPYSGTQLYFVISITFENRFLRITRHRHPNNTSQSFSYISSSSLTYYIKCVYDKSNFIWCMFPFDHLIVWNIQRINDKTKWNTANKSNHNQPSAFAR